MEEKRTTEEKRMTEEKRSTEGKGTTEEKRTTERGETRAQMEWVTPEKIEEFLENIAARGRGSACVESYRRILAGVYEFLPGKGKVLGPATETERVTGAESVPREGSVLGSEIVPGKEKVLKKENGTGSVSMAGAEAVPGTMGRWMDGDSGPSWLRRMKEQGLSPRTVNTRISAWNSFMRYLKRKEWYLEDFETVDSQDQPELSRSEYLRLLAAARNRGKDRTYMLIKALGGAGLRVQELSQLTVESVRDGRVPLERHNGRQSRILHLPLVFQRELQNYLERNQIRSGPVFVTGTGRPLPRSAINSCISQLSLEARVQAEKANPRCLRNMYEETQRTIQSNISLLVEQAYEQQLEREELSVGWEE